MVALKTYAKQPITVLMAMGGAVMGVGKRNKQLHEVALRLAKKIGPIDFDERGKCPPMDVAKNLMHPAITSRL